MNAGHVPHMAQLLLPGEAAKALRVEEKTLAKWRCEGVPRGLPYVKVGQQVRYRVADVVAFIEQNVRQGS